MSDIVILGIVLGGISVLGASIAIWVEIRLTKKSTDWHADLRALQLESARLTLQGRRDMADLKAYLKSVGIRLEQVFERVDER